MAEGEVREEEQIHDDEGRPRKQPMTRLKARHVTNEDKEMRGLSHVIFIHMQKAV